MLIGHLVDVHMTVCFLSYICSVVSCYNAKLFKFFWSFSFPGPPLSPQESAALLTQAGLFDSAFTVAFHFNLPKETVFEGLASRYLARHSLSSAECHVQLFLQWFCVTKTHFTCILVK